MKIQPLRLALLVVFLWDSIAALGAGDVFWRYGQDRYNRASLAERLDVPQGVDPYEFLARHRGFDEWMIRKDGDVTFLAERATSGVVPILCLHKLSREEDYALTPERFQRLLEYIGENGWYLVSDLQYLQGDFSRVPTGLKPIVMGADDASYGNLVYQTWGDGVTGGVKRFFGKPIIDRDSMVAILERHAAREEGRINFTFYISFDGIPFRQLDGAKNPGFPYPDIPVVAEKIQYIDENFILGIHSLSHVYAHKMGPDAFAQDLRRAWELLDNYAGGEAKSLHTLAFPYGISPLTPAMRNAVSSLSRHGRYLKGAFDFDNNPAPPPGAPGDLFDVSRFNADNRHWDFLMKSLEEIEAVNARREVIWETETKRLPRSPWKMGATSTDGMWILVRESSEDLATSTVVDDFSS